MSTTNKKPRSEKRAKRVEDATSLAFKAAAVALLPTSPAGSALAISGGLVSALGAAHRILMERESLRVGRLLIDAYMENSSPEGFAANIEQMLAKPTAKQVFLESMRSAVEAVSDEVLPALAALMREYEQTGREADTEFRSFCRLLAQLSPEEYASFRGLFRAAAAFLAGMDTEELIMYRGFAADGNGRIRQDVYLVARLRTEATQPETSVEDCAPRHFTRLSHLLYLNGFGDKGRGGISITYHSEGHDEVRMDPRVAGWLAQFLIK